MPKKVLVGVVTSDQQEKTRRVEVPRSVKHPKYGKFLRRKTICYVHDEKNECGTGDTVEIIECKPKSRTKRWELVKIIAKSTLVDVAAMRAEARTKTKSEDGAPNEAE